MSLRFSFFGLGVAAVAVATLAGCGGSEANDASTEAEVKTVKVKAKFVCREFNRKTEKLAQRIVVLKQTDNQGLKEGKKLAFDLDIYQGANALAEKSFKGTAQTEDVVFDFTSADGKAGFRLYLDEFDQSGLTLGGKNDGAFLCQGNVVGGEQLVCAEYNRKNKKLNQRTAVLTQTDKRPLVEGRKSNFDLELYEGVQSYSENTTEGTVETEDVMFNFTSNDGKTKFHHFMDEIEEAGLEVDGKASGDYVCH